MPPWDRHAEFLIVLLRLAVLLHRGRSPQPLPEVRLRVKGRSLSLELPQGWMKEHPLTLEDLEQERAYLKEAGFRLSLNRSARAAAQDSVSATRSSYRLNRRALRRYVAPAPPAREYSPSAVELPGLAVVREIQVQVLGDARLEAPALPPERRPRCAGTDCGPSSRRSRSRPRASPSFSK